MKVSSQRPDYKVKPISEEKRVAGKRAMYETANSAMKLAKDVGKGIKNQVIPELKKGLSSPQPNSVKAIANRVKSRELAKKPKAKAGR